MADYTVRIVAETDDADKKVKRLDERLKSVSSDKKIHIQLPGIQETIDNIKSLGNALNTTYKIARNIPVIGPKIQDVEDLGDIALNSAKKVVQAGKLIASATPGNIISGGFSGSLSAVNQLAKTTAELGYTVFGVTQSVNVLKAAFGGFFDDTIGREIRLQEALLRTKTTLASTTDVAVNGKRITDPYQAILKLERPINDTLDSIRVRSLEIAGTTSDAIVQVFGVVASQIGNIGGSLKDAEDLAITFSAALGTLGLSDPFYATQEIRSILTGTIDQNSILARSLGLTNEEVTKAKSSADGLVAFLQKRLAAFTAGQSLAAKGFAGITSNIQEFSEELKRAFGKGFLAPLLDGLTVLYQRLQLVFKPAFGIADALGKTGGAIARGFVGAAAAAPSIQGVSGRKALSATEGGEKYAISAFLQIQTAVDKLRPQIASLVDQAVKGLAQLSGGFVKLLEGFANFKFEQFKIYLSALTTLGQVLNATVIPAFTALMRVYGEILKNPIGQWFTQLSTTMSLLEKAGVLPLARTLFLLSSVIPSVINTFKVLGQAFDWIKIKLAGLVDFIITGFSMAVSAVSTVISELGRTLINVAQLGVNKFLLALQSAAGQLGVFLVELGTTIQQLYPKFGQLGVGVASVGKAIIGTIPALEKARLSYAQFAISAIESLTKLQVKTEQVKQGVATFGERIKGAIGGAAGVVATRVKDMVKGLIIFQLEMLALQLIIGVATKVISDWQRKQQEISDQTRAELAVKRLSTVYAEVGENATAATKAAKAFEEQLITNRIDAVTKSLSELGERINELNNLGSNKGGFFKFMRMFGLAMNPANMFDQSLQVRAEQLGKQKGNQWKSGLQLLLEAKVQLNKESVVKAQQELERLTKFQEKQKLNEKATEDVQILAKERAQLEKEIKEMRKQYAKELSDFEWSEKQKVLQLEQQMREADRQAARNDMQRRFAEENKNLGDISKGFKTILDEYQTGIFDAQTESEKRQFELATKREELEKQVADYAYRLEEQRTKLREKIGNYEQKLEDYKNEQAKRRSREVLQNALEAAGVMDGINSILLTPQDKSEFLNRAAQQGVSAERTLAYAMGGLTAEQKAMSPAQLVDELVNQFGPVLKAPEAEFQQKLGQRSYAVGQSKMPNYLMGVASATLGTGQFKTTAPPTPPKTNAVETFINDSAGYTAGLRSALEQTFAISKEAAQQANQIATAENWKKFIASLGELSRWGISTSAGQLSEQIDAVTNSLTLMDNNFKYGRIPSRTSVKLSNFEPYVEAAFGSLQTSMTTGMGAEQKKQYEEYFKGVLELVFNTILGKQNDSTLRATIKTALGRPDLKIVGAYMQVVLDIFGQLKQIIKKEAELEFQQIKQQFATLRQGTLDPQGVLSERLTELGQIQASMLPAGYSLQKANKLSDIQSYQTTQQLIGGLRAGERTPEKVMELLKEGQKLAEAYRKQNERLDPLNRALADLTTRVGAAARATETIYSAHRTLAESFLNGSTDLRESVREFSTSISRGFIQQFLDFAMAPLKEQVFDQMKKLFGVESAQDRAQAAMVKAQTDFGLAVEKFDAAVNKLTTAGIGGPDLPQEAMRLPVQDYTAPAVLPTSSVYTSLEQIFKADGAGAVDDVLTDSFNGIGDSLAGLGTVANETNKQAANGTKNLGKFLGAMTGVATGALAITGAIQAMQSSKGGTYETLMGIAGVLGGLGSIFGGISSLGKRAAGGPVNANRPYVVGEVGPELFVPSGNGTILPNNRMGQNPYAASSAYLEQQTVSRSFRSDPIKVDTRVINSVEYVTAGQLQEATRQAEMRGAERGQAMSLASLQNSVRTRKRIGL